MEERQISHDHHRRHQRRSRVSRLVSLLVAASLVAAACDHGGKSSSSSGGATGVVGAPRVFGLRLSEGQAIGDVIDAARLVDGTSLDAATIAAIRERLPEWAGGTGEAESFNWPTQSVPPPLTGNTIDESFPPATSVPPDPVPVGPLHVLRHQPDGDVSVAPYIAITFDQPMVAVGTLGQLSTDDVPVTITPAIPGRWQWIGTRTLRFDHASDLIDRLPMATTYTVEVPAGTRSAVATGSNGVLADAVSFTFTTPSPTVESFWPQGEGLPLTPVFIATFDQLIDPAAVLATVRLTADGDNVAVRLATTGEIAADDAARQATSYADAGRWLAFRAVDPLPKDAALAIAVGPNTPSAEGPNTATSTATFTGRTFAPLRIVGVSCDRDDRCPPGSALSVQFNNALDVRRSTDSVTVSPSLANMHVAVQYSSVTISGSTQPRTEYAITVPGTFTDVFGQTLGDDQRVTAYIDSASPSVVQFPSITTLDPFADRQQLSVVSVNQPTLRVRTFAADPSMVDEYFRYLNQRDSLGIDLPGWTELSDDTLSVSGTDVAVETPIDLSDVLNGQPGHLIVLIEPLPSVPPTSPDYWSNRPAITWVQSTQLGVDAFTDHQRLYSWVTDLRTGRPVAGVSLQLSTGDSLTSTRVTTDDDGAADLALLARPVNSSYDSPMMLVATKGDDTAVLPASGWLQPVADEARWYVFDDRSVYRPDESGRVKGWVRRLTLTGDADLVAVKSSDTIAWTLTDSFGNQLDNGVAQVGSLGGFDLQFDVPDNADLGAATLQMQLRGEAGLNATDFWHQVQIQQYRTPEFEVVTRPESATPFVSTSPATVAATASYYAGGPLAAAPVDWLVSTTPTTYAPPGWDQFTFGIWIPWWNVSTRSDGGYIDGGDMGYSDMPIDTPMSSTEYAQYSGTTDASGTHYLRIDFVDDNGALPDLPVAISAQATVSDVNRQAWSSTSNLLVHAASLYVGLRSERTFVQKGDSLSIEGIVTDIDGAAAAGIDFTMVAGRVEWQYVDGEWTEVVVDEQTCEVTSTLDAVSCDFATTEGGEYRVTSVVADGKGGHNRTELTTWVSGGESVPSRLISQQSLTVVPDRAEYAAGDTAELLVQAPFATGEGYAMVLRNGVRATRRFSIVDGSAVVRVPITEADVPQLTVSLEVVGVTGRTAADGTPLTDLPDRPAYATGTLVLSVPPLSRTLAVTATPRETEVGPGGSTTIDVSVKDASGRAVQGAEFAVVVVDEAVLALSGYTLADPLSVFYAPGYESLMAAYGRSLVQLATPAAFGSSDREDGAASETTAASNNGYDPALPDDGDKDDSGGESSGGGDGSIDVRSNFDALALFEPSVITDASGSAAIPVTLPDNLTRYRVMVVAVSGANRFGKAEANITARLPLSVRPSAPRFANFGDAFELPVVVQNLGDTALEVNVVLEGSNLAVDGASTSADGHAVGRTVAVPAGERVEVRFPVSTEQAGTAGFRVTAVSGDLADSATITLPVYTPVTAEAFATYGVIDSGAVLQPLLAPEGVISQFGGLEISTSSTALQALTDAVIDLVEYPYDSSDGRASRILTIAALRPVLDAFDVAGLPSAARLDAAVRDDIAELAALQSGDGGFPYWSRMQQSEPYNSVEATHALVVAKANGYAVPSGVLSSALSYLANIESYIPSTYGDQQRDTVRSYALWVRALAGQRDPMKAAALYEERHSAMTVDALAWMWSSLDNSAQKEDVRRTIANRAVETASTANFVSNYDDRSYMVMASDRRTDGIVLDALIDQDPNSDLIPKVVAGLLANRIRGSWEGVQENTFILLALERYFRTYETQDPNFVARVWLGDRFAGEHTFTGRETDRVNFGIGTSDLIATGDTNLVLSKTGAGRLYYRIGLRYAPNDLQSDALDRGFVVQRAYEAVDNPSDVRRDADGTWHIRAGARVRVTLTMVAESQRTHVALIDPLPAGLESLNPSLSVTQSTVVPSEGDSGGGVSVGGVAFDSMWPWWGRWYEHEQLRTDRTEAFTTLLPAGTYSYSYVARATTLGSFVVPPTRAEEMYAPETFGRSASDRMVVED